ncbi:hypothetical protein JCM17843_28050 [Kordiimonadales bacterium JCM 17843]|nr:hypothetical protein JCM17843_28050 [Kordiimonadales bacterium JCM 17843]
MAVFHQYLLWICVFLALGLSLSACGESGLPDYDENATYNGRTLSEVTPGLSDINPERRMLTLRDVAQFGVNALPAREKIRIMAQEDTDDRVKVGALATLHQMQDPQLPDLFSKLLSDPQYTAQSRTWQELVNRAPEVLGEEELEDFAAQVTKDNPEHAEMLFSLAVNTDAASAFGVALMDRDVSPSTTQKLMIVMPDMDLPDPRKIDWIKDHHMQMPNLRVALQTLQRMGGQEALDASLALLAEYPLASVADYRQTLRAFSGSMPPAQSIKIYGGLIEKTGQSEQDLQSLFGEMAGLVARLKQSSAVVRNSAQGEQAQADYRQAQDAYHDMLQNLMAHDLPLVRALAAGSLIDATVQDPLEPRRLMTPAFQLLKNEEQEVVIGTIVQRLKGVLPRIDYNAHPDLVEALAESIYARPSEDKWAYAVADGVVKAFDSAMRSRRLPQELAIPNVVDQSLAHTGIWPIPVCLIGWLPGWSRAIFPKPWEMKRRRFPKILENWHWIAVSHKPRWRLFSAVHPSRGCPSPSGSPSWTPLPCPRMIKLPANGGHGFSKVRWAVPFIICADILNRIVMWHGCGKLPKRATRHCNP